ncbi:hypothetical protein Pla100_18710 [Neorhodopirellula pilleata]|uniref:HEAT repeat protein n=2 Tax=Neorhodopirellula pilleata TaxID=2714738 RepID=A0A5C6AH22_9BACT|nr:hypothetical protein Pla100_18710 [Neorhodopirellula pilleata]
MSVEGVEAKVRELDRKLESLADMEESIKEYAEKLRASVDAKVARLKDLRDAPEKLSAEALRRGAMFLGGDEAAQLKSLDGIVNHQPSDEAVLFCGHVAQRSEYESVRREALRAACSLGKTGYPAIAIAYQDLNTTDRFFLLEQIRSLSNEDRAVLMASMAKDASEPLVAKLIEEPFDDDRRFVLLGKLADDFGDQAMTKILETARETQGLQGLAMLYAIAKSGEPKYVLLALKAARERGPSSYAVIVAAGKCDDPAVRAELVRAAKAWGGEAGERIIDKALADSNESLRQAAAAVMGE